MKVLRTTAALAALAGAATSVGLAIKLSEERERFLLGGIQVNEADHGHWFRTLRRAGMNTVSVTVYAKQGDWDTDNLWWEDEEPAVVAELRGAKVRGLKTVLIPRVALDHAFPRNRYLWHGLIMPGSDELLDRWFARYREFVSKWAHIARREHVDLLALGSELNMLTSTVPVAGLPGLERYYLSEEDQLRRRELILREAARVGPHELRLRGGEQLPSLERYLVEESAAHRAWADRVLGRGGAQERLRRLNRRRARLQDHWEALIRQVRAVYPGPLTFAANFDQYREVGFWEGLDRIGINAYFPLRGDGAPTSDLYAALEAGWTDVLQEIDEFRESLELGDMPVVFTELGYAAKTGVTLAPWSGSGFVLLWTGADEDARVLVWNRQPDEFGERALAVRALHAALAARDDRLVQGLLYWKLTTQPAHREIEPFVHVLQAPDDPLGHELRRFREWPNPASWLSARRDPPS